MQQSVNNDSSWCDLPDILLTKSFFWHPGQKSSKSAETVWTEQISQQLCSGLDRCRTNHVPHFLGSVKRKKEHMRMHDIARSHSKRGVVTMVVIVKLKYTKFTNPTTHLSHTPQCTIQNGNVYTAVLNSALWDIRQVQFGTCETGLSHSKKIAMAILSQDELLWLGWDVR